MLDLEKLVDFVRLCAKRGNGGTCSKMWSISEAWKEGSKRGFDSLGQVLEVNDWCELSEKYMTYSFRLYEERWSGWI